MDDKITEHEKKTKTYLVILASILLITVAFGFIYLSTTPATTLTLLLSFTGGISNIILPCTLPLVFIIVPLAMAASGAKKGLIMTGLFGLGLIITLAVYGAAIAQVGEFLGLDNATRIMYAIAGIASVLFGLSELKLIKFKLPSYMGTPKFMENRGDYTKIFFLGLLLGNAGIGCPNPITYIILIFAATSGDWLQGAFLMGINGLGRVVPLLLMSVLGILGVNAMGGLTKRIESIRRLTGWALLILGMFIILNGTFGHLWYEGGIFHEGVNGLLMASGGKMIGEADVEAEEFEEEVPYHELGPWINLVVTIPPVFWYWKKYPSLRSSILKVLMIVIIWDVSLFNFGISAHEMFGLEWGLPDIMPGNMTGMT